MNDSVNNDDLLVCSELYVIGWAHMLVGHPQIPHRGREGAHVPYSTAWRLGGRALVRVVAWALGCSGALVNVNMIYVILINMSNVWSLENLECAAVVSVCGPPCSHTHTPN